LFVSDLTNKPGYWAKALAERFAERDTVLFYYVTQAGDVHFGINGEEKGVFFSGVETRGPLWAIIDVYGNSTAIELVDPRQQLNNSRRNLAMGGDASPGDSAAMERLILPSLTALTINQQNHQQPQSQRNAVDDATTNDIPGPRFQQPGIFFSPLPFHRYTILTYLLTQNTWNLPRNTEMISCSPGRCVVTYFIHKLNQSFIICLMVGKYCS
jgi:protein neuralized